MVDEFDANQFKEIFVSEAKEHLSVMNSALLSLEKNPQDTSLLNEIFRVAHTLKGMSATMGFDKITELTHNMEDVLEKFRSGKLVASKETVNILFECFDILELLIEEVSTGENKGIEINYLLEKLKEINNSITTESTDAEIKCKTDEKKTEEGTADTKFIKGLPGGTQTIRIKTEQLDKLMNLVGELVIAKARVDEISKKEQLAELSSALSQMSRITIDLQEDVLKTRMIPVSYIFNCYPRMVRDLAYRLNKEIEFVMSGTDIELDRVLLDQINEPLVHILRNAVDHGIELPEVRKSLGKPTTGVIKLTARREKGYAWIEVTDDGKGMDPEEIRQKALEKGIITPEQALSKEEIFMLICHPAFSTAKEITDISGRGVGMDVVKNLVEAFNGKLEIRSEKGVGSTFILHLPLSLAIIQALLVRVANEIYAIPFTNVNEITRIEKEYVKTVAKREVLVLRDEVIPLINIGKYFEIVDRTNIDSNNYAVIVETRNKKIGLIVDKVINQQEIVVKTLSEVVKNARFFSGATILGDGRVVLIIDITALCESFGIGVSNKSNS